MSCCLLLSSRARATPAQGAPTAPLHVTAAGQCPRPSANPRPPVAARWPSPARGPMRRRPPLHAGRPLTAGHCCSLVITCLRSHTRRPLIFWGVQGARQRDRARESGGRVECGRVEDLGLSGEIYEPLMDRIVLSLKSCRVLPRLWPKHGPTNRVGPSMVRLISARHYRYWAGPC